jgi:hypothetical protein
MGGKSSSLELFTVILGNATGGSLSADGEETGGAAGDPAAALAAEFGANPVPDKNKPAINPTKRGKRAKFIETVGERLSVSMSEKDSLAKVKLRP